MKIDYIRFAINNLIHKKLRSWLTVVSILIGIASIFALVSFGQGLSTYVSQIAEEAGSDKLIITAKGTGAPGMDANFFISNEDIDVVDGVNGIKEIVGMYFKVVEVRIENELKYPFLISEPVNNEYKKLVREFFTIDVFKGRGLRRGDDLKVVLGYNYQFPKKIFEVGVGVGDRILINDKKYEIVGFYEEVGNAQDDSNIYLTTEAFESLIPDVKNEFAMVLARVEPGMDPASVAEHATRKLAKHKNLDEGDEDFYIQTYDQMIEMFGSVLGVINGVLVLIALISLIVAGVNIMNTMYTSVLERTKEIGVLKSIGAKNLDIMILFLFESGIVSLIGGVLGVGLGYIIAKIGEFAAANAGYAMLKPVFPLSLIIGCLLFAFFVGVIAGFLPARQASKLKPIDALRYE